MHKAFSITKRGKCITKIGEWLIVFFSQAYASGWWSVHEPIKRKYNVTGWNSGYTSGLLNYLKGEHIGYFKIENQGLNFTIESW